MTNYTDGQIVSDTEISKANLATAMRSFEAWVIAQSWFVATVGLSRCANGIEYNDPLINSRWQGWQACAERQAAKAGVHALWVSIDRMIVDAWKVGIEGKNLDMLAMVKRFNDAMLASVWPTAGGDSTMACELEDCKKAYALLFAENAKIRSMEDIIPGLVKALQDAVNNPNDDAYWIKQATDAIAAAEGEKK